MQKPPTCAEEFDADRQIIGVCKVAAFQLIKTLPFHLNVIQMSDCLSHFSSVGYTLESRVRQPPLIPRGLSPLPLPAKGRQGAAPCIS